MEPLGRRARRRAASFRMLGVRVDAVQIPDVIAQMERWIQERERTHYIAVTGMHGVTVAQRDPAFKKTLNAADLVVPDGMSLVWLSRVHGLSLKRRVYGPELMLTFCEQTARKGYRHYFYGGTPGVAALLAERFVQRFEGLRVAGICCPPFRSLRSEEREEHVKQINSSQADIVWVGLSTPKQEKWMYEFREHLNVPVLMGVGAAFDIHSGRVPQAPAWMRENGFEWLYRLLHEPQRLWRRYLIGGAQFVWYVFLELTGFKKFE